jgi:hypothetical protein
MSKYKILPYSYDQAKKLDVVILPSSNPRKKIDVYKESKKVASIGAYGYPDFAYHMKTEGKAYADERRRLYKARHNNTRTKKGSASWWADKLLW